MKILSKNNNFKSHLRVINFSVHKNLPCALLKKITELQDRFSSFVLGNIFGD